MPSSVSTTTIAALWLTTVPRSLVYHLSSGIGALSSMTRTSRIFMILHLSSVRQGTLRRGKLAVKHPAERLRGDVRAADHQGDALAGQACAEGGLAGGGGAGRPGALRPHVGVAEQVDHSPLELGVGDQHHVVQGAVQ